MSGLVGAVRRARVHDVSPLIHTGMTVFPGHPAVEVDGTARTHAADGYFVQALSLGEHTGSHMDAPAHALAGRQTATIDTFPAARFVVPYVLLDLSELGLEPGQLAGADDLRRAHAASGAELSPGDAALIHFGWDRHADRADGWWAANAPGLDGEACSYLVSLGVGLVGSDTATCDTAVVDGTIVSDVGHLVHFLPNDILIVEGLRGLGTVPPSGVFVGAPLKIDGGSGSPIRALLLCEEDT